MPTLPPLIEAMGQPRFYPGCSTPVELRQTHISYVFLVGEFVYKVKKPVRFTFLNYSMLERRHHFCQEEVRLNRRLAPTVYLGVVPILKGRGGFVLGKELAMMEKEMGEAKIDLGDQALDPGKSLERILFRPLYDRHYITLPPLCKLVSPMAVLKMELG